MSDWSATLKCPRCSLSDEGRRQWNSTNPPLLLTLCIVSMHLTTPLSPCLSIDGAEFWKADESPEHKNFSPETLGGGTVRIALIKDDPDDAFALAKGCR